MLVGMHEQHDADVVARRDSLVVGFSRNNANCACAKRGFSRQLDLDIVYIVNSERAKNRIFVALSS